MKRLLSAMLLLGVFATPVLAQRQPVMMENGKRVQMVRLPDGTTRKVYLDYRMCEELSSRADCDARMMANRPPPPPMDTRPSQPTQPVQVDEGAARATTIAGIAMDDPRFSRLVSLLQQAGLADALMGEGPFTVFAPTNAAFDRANQEALNHIVNDPARLRNLLMYHVIRGRYDGRTLNNRASSSPGFTEQTLAGPLPTAAGSAGYTIGNVQPITFDVRASNGFIHVIDHLIKPPSENGLDR